jgi:ABC-type transport system involved in multi-copper enzyme maturation permease subunit
MSALITLLVFVVLFVVLIFFAVGSIPGKMMAVAQAAYKESIRQPLFWLLLLLMIPLMLLSIIIPYFTLGEDLKMLKELQLSGILLPPLILTFFTAAISVAEEIEGRTAVTLLSKPVARRDFLLGKYFGILAAALLMILILTLIMGWTINVKIDYENLYEDMLNKPEEARYMDGLRELRSLAETLPTYVQEPVVYILRIFMVIHLLAAGPFCHFCQVAIMTAITVALATRLPFVLNLFVGLVIFFVGNLVSVLKAQASDLPLVRFVAELFGLLLPSLNVFKIESSLASGLVIVPWGAYTAQVALHAVIYCTLAMLVGLLLFEDRDVA